MSDSLSLREGLSLVVCKASRDCIGLGADKLLVNCKDRKGAIVRVVAECSGGSGIQWRTSGIGQRAAESVHDRPRHSCKGLRLK